MGNIKSLDKFKLKETIYILVHKMLDENDPDGLKRIRLDSHGIFSIDENGNLITKIIDTSEELDVKFMEECITNMCRIVLIGDTYRAVAKETKVDEIKTHDWSSTGSHHILELKVFKVRNSETGEIDYSALDAYTSDSIDFTVAVLELNGYTQGYYHPSDQSVFGTDDKGNNKLLASFRLKAAGKRPLAFSDLGKTFDRYRNQEKVSTIKLPYEVKPIIDPTFTQALSRTGIMVIRDMRTFNVVDMIIRAKYDEGSQINITQLGAEKSTLLEHKGYIEYFRSANDDFWYTITQNYGRIILDQERRLTLAQVNKVAEDNLVIINTNDDKIETFYSQFDSEDETVKKAFTGRLRYFGNPNKKDSSIYITDLERKLLDKEEYKLVDTTISTYTPLKSILEVILNNIKDTNRIYNNGSSIYVEHNPEGKISEPSRVKRMSITKAHLVEFLSEEIGLEVEEAIEITSSKKPYVGMVKINGEDKNFLIRINIIPSHTRLPNIYLSRIPDKRDDLKQEDLWESNLNLIIGRRGSGKTDMIRANIPMRENLYVYDTDYEFSELEKDDYKCLSMVVERNELNIREIRQINPTLVVINSELSVEEIIPIMTLANRGMKVIISMTSVAYNILKENEKYIEAEKHYGFNPNIIIKKGEGSK